MKSREKFVIIFLVVALATIIQFLNVFIPAFRSFTFFVSVGAIFFVTYRTFIVLDNHVVIDKLRTAKKYIVTVSVLMAIDFFVTWQLYLGGIDFFKAEANSFATWIVGLVGEAGFVLCFFLGLYVFCLMMINVSVRLRDTFAKAVLCLQLIAITSNVVLLNQIIM